MNWPEAIVAVAAFGFLAVSVGGWPMNVLGIKLFERHYNYYWSDKEGKWKKVM
jgi:hypothetical protein